MMKSQKKGLVIQRRYTKKGVDPLENITYELRTSRITNPDGSVVFEMKNVEVPGTWTQVATDILAQKYFRKKGVSDEKGGRNGSEWSAKQVVRRLAGTWRHWGEKYDYFASKEDADAFEDEMKHILINQMGAPNSPQWFNTGLSWAYDIKSEAQGHYFVDPKDNVLKKSDDAYTRGQVHACFIQSIKDDLVNEGGIFDLMTREARLFKYGSGCTGAKSFVWTTFCGLEQMDILWDRLKQKSSIHEDKKQYASFIEPPSDIYTLALRPDGTFVKDRITAMWRFSVQPKDKLRIKTEKGAEALVSRWHPCMVLHQGNIIEKRADELVPGDMLVGPNHTVEESWPFKNYVHFGYSFEYFEKEETNTLDIDEDIAWLTGYFIGDGSIGKRQYLRKRTNTRSLRVRFYDETKENLVRVQKILDKKFGAISSIRKNAPGKSKAYELTVTQARTVAFFENIAQAGPKTYSVELPHWIFKSPLSVIHALIAGLLDSDGTVSRDSHKVRATVSTASPRLAEQLQALIAYLGLTTTFKTTKQKKDRTQSILILSRNTPAAIKEKIASFMSHPIRKKYLLKAQDASNGLWRKEGISWNALSLETIMNDPGLAVFRKKYLSDLYFVIHGQKFYLAPARCQNRIGRGRVKAFLETCLPHLTKYENRILANRLLTVLYGLDGVKKIESAHEDTKPFYDFTTAQYHTYLAGERGMMTIHNTGTNFSAIRGKNESLSGGGKSSGLMSFLQTIDRAAGAIKSGGTTRRAAKMVCLDMDHPEIEDFIKWKTIEEQKVAALHAGSYICFEHLKKILVAAHEKGLNPSENPLLRRLIREADKAHVPLNYIKRVLMLAEQGVTPEKFDFRTYDMDFRSEAYLTVSGQNSNNSVRIPNGFLDAVKANGEWELKNRADGSIYKSIKAKKLWGEITFGAWACADPGVQYDTVINEWHTCPEDGSIKASNPCVTGDTLVATDDGFRRIKDLVGTDVSIFDPLGEIQKTKGVFKTGFKPIYKLRTKSGYSLKVTADHLIFTDNRGFLPASHLTKEDQIRIGPVRCFGTKSLEKSFAELIGLAVGDGCVTDKTLFITLAKEEAELANSYNQHLQEYKEKNAADGRGARTVHVVETPTTLRLNTGASAVINAMQEYAILNEGSHRKTFTDAIYDLDENSVAALLRGLFTADGTIANYGEKSQYISLDSSSIELLEQVQLLLLQFGIKAKLYKNRRAGNTTSWLPDGKGSLEEYPVLEMHSLRISRFSRKVFQEKIGFLKESPKMKALQQMNGEITMYADKFTDSFKSLVYLSDEDVYDLTEPKHHAFFANGLLVHNCSEYMFLDDTACNLSSINLIKYYDPETRSMDIEGIKHASRLWTIVLEISVLMAQFPSKEIAQKSYDYRTLGLGYANLGTVLMRMGIPYSSEEAYAICGAITAIMCGQSYATSAEMAGTLGAFPRYEANKISMLRVMRNHRRAAYCASKKEYEGLSVIPHGIQEKFSPSDLLKAAKECWDRAVELGEKFGFRNAQVTCVAPTGTIGLVMDCDTTGIEPDFALVKFKKLVGGGYFKIVNQSVPKALKALDYTASQIKDIEAYMKGHATLKDCPHINEESLRERGFTDKELVAIEAQLAAIFELKFAFNKFTLGDEFCKSVLGMSEELVSNPNTNILELLGFTPEQIEEANEYVCGTMTIEDAPHLKKIHYPIFDCANRCGRKGKRFIPWEAHLRMMGAAQPFISGAISKTINMPEESKIQDVERAYFMSWEYMLKAVALYRDGSKLSQPLNTSSSDSTYASLFNFKEEMNEDESLINQQSLQQAISEEAARPIRRKLPAERHSITHKFTVANHEGYITIGLYEDGAPGEIFIKMSKEGSTLSGIMDAFALTISLCLQYGVPLEVLVAKFSHSRFEPSGMTGNRNIPLVKSIVDYIGRYLALKFLPKEVAKKYHNEELIDRAYAETNPVHLPQLPLETSAEPTKDTLETPGTSLARGHASILSPRTKEQLAKAQTNLVLALNNEDAPMCGTCGVVMVRNGACYKCLECGETSGCS